MWFMESQQIHFEELGAKRTFAAAELQARANGNPWQEGRRQFKAPLGEMEVAYLSFDAFWDDQINLYEIFVASDFRNRGVGCECIRFAIKLTRQLGKPRLTVRAGYLGGQSKAEVVEWYKRRGYTHVKGEQDFLEIVV
jgi:GNAT superfamily N-acetyltransferase